MEKKLRNKTGFRTLKLRLLLVLIIAGSYVFVALDLWDKYHNESMIFLIALAVIIFSIIIIMSPITVRHNGFEQRV